MKKSIKILLLFFIGVNLAMSPAHALSLDAIIDEFILISENTHTFHILVISALLILLCLIMVLFLINNRNLNKQILLRKEIELKAITNEMNLERSLALSKATLEASTDGILVIDKERKIVGFNKRFSSMWKIPEEVLASGNEERAAKYLLSQVKHPTEFIKNLELLFSPESESEAIDTIEFKDGKKIERYTMPLIRGEEFIGRVFSFRDITKRKEMEAELIYQTTHDTLTLLPNQLILFDRIYQAIQYSKRACKISAVLFFNINRFKLVNNCLGHDMGDLILQSIARRLKGCVRENDTVARWRGDEFVILLTSLTRLEDIKPIANKCLFELQKAFPIDQNNLNLTTSIGISTYPKDGDDVSTLLKNANSAMHFAKTEERNNYIFYTPDMNTKTTYQLELTHDLQSAIKK